MYLTTWLVLAIQCLNYIKVITCCKREIHCKEHIWNPPYSTRGSLPATHRSQMLNNTRWVRIALPRYIILTLYKIIYYSNILNNKTPVHEHACVYFYTQENINWTKYCDAPDWLIQSHFSVNMHIKRVPKKKQKKNPTHILILSLKIMVSRHP